MSSVSIEPHKICSNTLLNNFYLLKSKEFDSMTHRFEVSLIVKCKQKWLQYQELIRMF